MNAKKEKQQSNGVWSETDSIKRHKSIPAKEKSNIKIINKIQQINIRKK